MATTPFCIEHASVTDAGEILALQKLAYESEARLYDDWDIPPMTETKKSAIYGVTAETKRMGGGRLMSTFVDGKRGDAYHPRKSDDVRDRAPRFSG